MRHRKKGRKLGRTAAHRRAMVRNLVCDLMLAAPEGEGPRRITTTIPKAKEARRLAEKVITLGKRGTLHARRRALALLGDKAVVKLVFEEVAPLYNDRPGGYTRILRLPASRRGDGADLCYLELVAEELEAAPRAEEPVAPKVSAQAPPSGAPEGPDEEAEAPADASEDEPAEDDDEEKPSPE
jgi:large subunit ribosomal protein L17